jgi:hypothetical protein
VAEIRKSATSLVEVHARELGIVHKVWGNTGWRVIHRIVTDIERDPEYTDVEVGRIKAGGRLWHVWRRDGGTHWSTHYGAVTRYARCIPTKYDEEQESARG